MKYLVEKILKFFTRRIIKKYHPDIIGIVGSIGKTMIKDATVHLLGGEFRTVGNPDSYNTKIGVSLTVIGKKSPGRSVWGWLKIFFSAFKLWLVRNDHYPEILVLEMAASQPGDLHYLHSVALCQVAIVSAVSPVHLEFFKTVKKISQEARWLVSRLPKTGFAVLNRDDEEVYAMKKKTEADVVTFGFHSEADVRASDVVVKINTETGWPEGLVFKVNYQGSVVPIYLPGVIGEHSIYTVLGAIAAALIFGLNLVEISHSLQGIKMPPGRMRLLYGIKNTLLIDDSFNASPAAVKAALQALSQIAVKEGGERYAVLGDMLELGRGTEECHRQIGLLLAELRINFLVTVGEAAKIIARAAMAAGLAESQLASFSSAQEAGLFLREKIKAGDLVLVKGSRALEMEKIVEKLS